jgi:hypothetical protein
MGVFYPQASLTLRVIWEDFNIKSDARLQEVYTLPILARRVTVNINDYTQADTFDAEIDYKNFPFDPRAIRACGVTVSMADVGSIFQGDNSLTALERTTANTIFQGFADTESISFDDTKRTVKFEGRDFTSLLIDRKYGGSAIDMNQPLDTILSALLLDLKETVKLELDNRIEEDLPVVGKFSPHRNTATKLGGIRNSAKEETYWEVIQDLVARSGLIAYVELDKLVLSKPRVLYSRDQSKKFVYGKNIKNLEYKRQIGRKKNFNVNVRSLNTDTKEILMCEIPLEATTAWSQSTGIPQKRIQLPTINSDGSAGTPKDAPIIGFRVPNVNDKPHLIEIGQEIYEELGRQQIDGSFTTKDLETSDGLGSCFNLLNLRNGSPLSIEVNQGDLAGINKVNGIPEKAKFLRLRGYEPAVADVLAQTLSNKRFHSPFYTKAVQFTLDSDTGLDIKVDFINFIETPERLGGNG